MQRSSQPAIVSTLNSWQDKTLYNIKENIQQSYWASGEGVFEFQFLADNVPLTNVISPQMFQLIRYTPNYAYEAYQTVIQGRLNNDGSIEYGGGRTGKLMGNNIVWNDSMVWNRVMKIAPKKSDLLDLGIIQKQARMDSNTLMDHVYKNTYLY